MTAAGFNWATTCAAIRAGLSGVREDNLWDPTAGARMNVGRPRTHQWWEGPDMLAELATPTILECLAAANSADTEVPIFVLLPPPDRPLRPPDLEQIVHHGIERRLGRALPPGSLLIPEGATGLFTAHERARRLIAGGQASEVVVVAAESFLRQPLAEFYIEHDRLLTADNSDGFIPGEAAAAILLARPQRRAERDVLIAGWGQGHEAGGILNDEPLSGHGLTRALRSALSVAGRRFDETNYWLTDQNGEAYRFKESTLAQIRLERRSVPATRPFPIWHPIEYLGEIGTAIGPTLLGLALFAHRHRFAPGMLGLMHVTEDMGQRSAFVLHCTEAT